MEEAEFYSFMLPPDPWRKKPSPSTFKMTIAEAAKRYPGAQPILSSREVRTIPQTEAEIRAAQHVNYPQYGQHRPNDEPKKE